MLHTGFGLLLGAKPPWKDQVGRFLDVLSSYESSEVSSTTFVRQKNLLFGGNNCIDLSNAGPSQVQ